MNPKSTNHSALFEIGFRPFFLGAGVFAVVSISLWALVYLGQITLSTSPISVFQWHAHEMIFGYALAVVAGFLLTAVSNWTGFATSTGKSLMLMFVCWCLARVLNLFGTQFVILAGVFDLIFTSLLIVSISLPIIRKRLWMRMAVVSKVCLLLVFNSLFLLGATGYLDNGVYLGVYGGLYLIIGLILTIGKNLVPFFIERGVGYQVTITNFRSLDIISLGLFLLFFVLELSRLAPQVAGVVSVGLFLVNIVRLGQWHTGGIWKKPLLWGLFMSYCFICLGFLFMAGHYFFGVNKFLAIHSFAVGGVGLITLSMMSRVALGHTGRDISMPPGLVSFSLLLMVVCACMRVILPLVWPDLTLDWMKASFIFWLVTFFIYLWVYAPILVSPRIDKS